MCLYYDVVLFVLNRSADLCLYLCKKFEKLRNNGGVVRMRAPPSADNIDLLESENFLIIQYTSGLMAIFRIAVIIKILYTKLILVRYLIIFSSRFITYSDYSFHMKNEEICISIINLILDLSEIKK